MTLNEMVARFFDRAEAEGRDVHCSVCGYKMIDPRLPHAEQVHVDGLRGGEISTVSHTDC